LAENTPIYFTRLQVVLSVTDGGMGECMDPEGNGVTVGRGASGGLAHPEGNKISI
jgi:hypothetical protein